MTTVHQSNDLWEVHRNGHLIATFHSEHAAKTAAVALDRPPEPYNIEPLGRWHDHPSVEPRVRPVAVAVLIAASLTILLVFGLANGCAEEFAITECGVPGDQSRDEHMRTTWPRGSAIRQLPRPTHFAPLEYDLIRRGSMRVVKGAGDLSILPKAQCSSGSIQSGRNCIECEAVRRKQRRASIKAARLQEITP